MKNVLEFVKRELANNFDKSIKAYGDDESTSVEFGELTGSYYNGTTLECEFEDGQYFIDGEKYNGKGISVQFTCAFKTPKGYISSKKIPVVIKDKNNVTLEEVAELLKFNTDAVKNGFDPFYHENEAKRRNACGWASIARSGYISEEDTF
tara:strand:+ start:656 stop:1105 length:450 start_codon:yes stop_codon:yes gene_type:complete